MCLKIIAALIISTTLFNCGSLSVTNSPKPAAQTVFAAQITDRAQTNAANVNYRNSASTPRTTAGQDRSTSAPRDKRGSNFHLDSSEIERQNNITQQIFANYLERRLFPYRSVNRKIPTIDDILPKTPKPTTARPRHRGFASSYSQSGKRRGDTSTHHSYDGAHNKNRHSQNRVRTQLVDNDDFTDAPDTHKAYSEDEEDDVDGGLEALQSVESEQHDQYYGHVLNRDPSENEIDSGEPCFNFH